MRKLQNQTRLSKGKGSGEEKLNLKLKGNRKRQQITLRLLPQSLKRLESLVKALKSKAHVPVSRTDVLEALIRDAVNHVELDDARAMITDFMAEDRGKTDYP